MNDRASLDIVGIDALDDFAPAQKKQNTKAKKKAVDSVSAFPSRESSPDAQMNLKGPQHIIERFKAMCKDDRRPYYDMLEILMDEFDRKN